MSKISLHLQHPVVDWLAVATAKADLIKVFQVEMGAQVKAISPNTQVIFRHHIAHQQPFLDRAGISDEEADLAALDFISRFSDSVNQHGHIDFVESLNETYPSHDPEAQRKAVAFDRAFIRMLPQVCPATKPVVFTAPIGNPDHHEYHILIALAAECEAAGGAFGYHAYWPVYHKQSFVNDPNVAHNLHMRWDYIDAYLIQRGIRVEWMLGEIGAIGCGPPETWPTQGYNLRADDGWKHSDVWNDDYLAYLEDLIAFDELLLGTVASREGRLHGGTIFTSGPEWEHFQIRQPILGIIADYIHSHPTPPPSPPPPSPEHVWVRGDVEFWNGRNGIWGIDLCDFHPGAGPIEVINMTEPDDDGYRWYHLRVFSREDGFEKPNLSEGQG